CGHDIQVVCYTTQTCRRSWWKVGAAVLAPPILLLTDTTYWDDVATRCPACPEGTQPKESRFRICCFKNSFVQIFAKATAPGPIAYVGSAVQTFDVFKETPTATVPVLAGIQTDCIEVNADEAQLLLDAMERALATMQATAIHINEVPRQQEAI